MPTLDAIQPTLTLSPEEPQRILLLNGTESAGDLPVGNLVRWLSPGAYEFVNDRGEVVARLEKLWTAEQEELATLIQQQITPEDLKDIQRQMSEHGPTIPYAEVRKRVFGEE